MPEWITSLLRELAPVPKRSSASRISVSCPRSASSRATARPMTPAPMTTAATSSIGAVYPLARVAPNPAAPYNACMTAVDYQRHDELVVVGLRHPPLNALTLE